MLWNIEFFTGEILEQQLSTQSALIVLVGGEASLEMDKPTRRMEQDVAYYCPADATFGVRSHGRGPLSLFVIHFAMYIGSSTERNHLAEADADRLLHGRDMLTVDSADRLSLWCRVMYDRFHSGDPLGRWRAGLEFQELLFEMISTDFLEADRGRIYGLERTKEYMDQHFEEELTIDKLAAIAKLSPKYYSDMFKKTYGLSATEYLAQIRMTRAKQLMLGSDRALKDVAHMVGYKDEFYFSRKFKKEIGLSPSAYIKTRKNKLALYGSSALLGYLTPLHMIPYAAPLHPKWSDKYYHLLGPDIPVHLDAYRQNHNRTANLDRLKQSRPELIVCSPGLETWEKETLMEIAPVHELPENSEGWEKQLRWLALLLDKNREAEQWIGSFRERLQDGKDELLANKIETPQKLLTARLHGQDLAFYRNQGMQEVLYDPMGLGGLFAGYEDVEGALKADEIRLWEADHILLLVRQDSETLEYWRRLQSAPDWLRIPAVQSGKLHRISSYPWREYSPVALEQMVEETVRIFSVNCP